MSAGALAGAPSCLAGISGGGASALGGSTISSVVVVVSASLSESAAAFLPRLCRRGKRGEPVVAAEVVVVPPQLQWQWMAESFFFLQPHPPRRALHPPRWQPLRLQPCPRRPWPRWNRLSFLNSLNRR